MLLCAIIWTMEKVLNSAPLPIQRGSDKMPIRYKLDILAELKKAGYSSTRIRNEKLMGQATLTQLRHGELVSWMNIETICRLLQCQPGDILEYIEESRDN